MALITDLPASSSVATTDLFVKDTGSATQKITASNLAAQLGGGLGLMTSNPDTLYNGGKITTGTLTISASYLNYKWLVFEYITNAERMTEFVPSALFSSTSTSLLKSASSGNWVSASSSFEFVSTCSVKRSGNTTFSITTKTNDANYVLGVVAVYGFK